MAQDVLVRNQNSGMAGRIAGVGTREKEEPEPVGKELDKEDAEGTDIEDAGCVMPHYLASLNLKPLKHHHHNVYNIVVCSIPLLST